METICENEPLEKMDIFHSKMVFEVSSLRKVFGKYVYRAVEIYD